MKGEVAITLITNLEILAPVYPQVMQFLKSIHNELSLEAITQLQTGIRQLILSNHYLIGIPLNLHYTVLLLGMYQTAENETLLNKLYYSGKLIEIIKKDIVLIMTKWSCQHWLSNLRLRYSQLSSWEKRAFIIASYVLGDEGRHWREHNKDSFNEFDIIIRDWAANKKQTTGFTSLI